MIYPNRLFIFFSSYKAAAWDNKALLNLLSSTIEALVSSMQVRKQSDLFRRTRIYPAPVEFFSNVQRSF